MARRYDPTAAREDILNAAERVFAEKGFARTSTQEVARAAGVSQSQIHYHFGTKEGLWDATHDRAFQDYYDAQVDILTRALRPGENRLERSIEAYFRFFESHPTFARIMMHNLLEGGSLGGDQGKHLPRMGAAVVQAEQEAGTLRDDLEPSFIVMSFLGLVAFWFMARDSFLPKFGLEGDPKAWNETYLENVKKVVLDGVLGPQAAANDQGDFAPGTNSALDPSPESDPYKP